MGKSDTQDQWTECAPVATYTGLCFCYAKRWLLQQSSSGMWILFENVAGMLDQGRTIAALTGPMGAERAQETALYRFIRRETDSEQIPLFESQALPTSFPEEVQIESCLRSSQM